MLTKVCPNVQCPDIELFGVQGRYGSTVDICAKCGTRLIPQDVEALTEQYEFNSRCSHESGPNPSGYFHV